MLMSGQATVRPCVIRSWAWTPASPSIDEAAQSERAVMTIAAGLNWLPTIN